jgi:hypothetical protein
MFHLLGFVMLQFIPMLYFGTSQLYFCLHYKTTEDMEDITIIGLGKHGVKVANKMYKQGFSDVSFIVCDSDEQILNHSLIEAKIKLDNQSGDGVGSSSQFTDKVKAQIEKYLRDTKLVMIITPFYCESEIELMIIISKHIKTFIDLSVCVAYIPKYKEEKCGIYEIKRIISKLNNSIETLLLIGKEMLMDFYTENAVDNKFYNFYKSLNEIKDCISKNTVGSINFADNYFHAESMFDSITTNIELPEKDNPLVKALKCINDQPFFSPNHRVDLNRFLNVGSIQSTDKFSNAFIYGMKDDLDIKLTNKINLMLCMSSENKVSESVKFAFNLYY